MSPQTRLTRKNLEHPVFRTADVYGEAGHEIEVDGGQHVDVPWLWTLAAYGTHRSIILR